MDENKPKLTDNRLSTGGKNKKRVQWDEFSIKQTWRSSERDSGDTEIRDNKEQEEYENANHEELNVEMSRNDLESSAVRPKIRSGNNDENMQNSAATRAFEQKRKLHYNEYYVAKLVKNLFGDQDISIEFI
ncbi:protein phosphatase inhibitor 2-like isoform X2 [Centruroides sculpturatus]|nr:protein phosphatase inhibitor 2-like isoform X2 [Centruroides sculpturatus]XP_023226346.1 protein phosphatase inhibitor 2-like isoform X2 [Centruroides sculpturatus]XP_023226347.1 protein phosphatase inhibitor 2-like isoform X2 [Centruroides sculpturatus]